MRSINKPIAFLVSLVLVLSLFLSACSGDDSDSNVVAKVGDAEITQELVTGLSAFFAFYNYGADVNTIPEDELKVWQNQVLVYMCVDTEVIKAHLKEEGKDLTDEQRTAITTNVEDIYNYEGVPEMLVELGVKKSDVEYFFEAQTYSGLFFEEVIEKDPVTDTEIETNYENYKFTYVSPAAIQASHILMLDAEHGEVTRAAIEDVLTQLNDGADFAELAQKYSEDSSAEGGGDLGWFSDDINFVPEFKEAVFALTTPGAISGIVETEFGYHIIKLTGKTDARQKTIDEVSAEISVSIENEHYNTAFDAMKAAFTIEYFVDVDPETGEPYMYVQPVTENITTPEGVSGS
ncbi:MAG: peptidylprolyl isomerase [Clostridiales Family XIII bacterium]|nr:peptidylprolyl isomerase [Clostridiales Family XIII bacterium]